MPDGSKRKRRNRQDTRAVYYAVYRSVRYASKYGPFTVDMHHIEILVRKEIAMKRS